MSLVTLINAPTTTLYQNVKRKAHPLNHIPIPRIPKIVLGSIRPASSRHQDDCWAQEGNDTRKSLPGPSPLRNEIRALFEGSLNRKPASEMPFATMNNLDSRRASLIHYIKHVERRFASEIQILDLRFAEQRKRDELNMSNDPLKVAVTTAEQRIQRLDKQVRLLPRVHVRGITRGLATQYLSRQTSTTQLKGSFRELKMALGRVSIEQSNMRARLLKPEKKVAEFMQQKPDSPVHPDSAVLKSEELCYPNDRTTAYPLKRRYDDAPEQKSAKHARADSPYDGSLLEFRNSDKSDTETVQDNSVRNRLLEDKTSRREQPLIKSTNQRVPYQEYT
ncbi:hypothetical protein K505DRAFT_362940 [Melanomma pulvis-pyrius CBS 109.77]|uniref:Uncharacterized protein n=1 Tax=Melanomma pulvis-pyrius CBS 109.77 TaxID=1314802 RepID=A0A6A6X8K0_9PLEO|nr:hypothetical protein K505DRAFT_362940 [Melanomma pulvis-pyrius CBS 109.77]